MFKIVIMYVYYKEWQKLDYKIMYKYNIRLKLCLWTIQTYKLMDSRENLLWRDGVNEKESVYIVLW